MLILVMGSPSGNYHIIVLVCFHISLDNLLKFIKRLKPQRKALKFYSFISVENPYDVADKWLINENLPLTFREQVVEFILQNSGQKTFTPDPSFRDPYTGGMLFANFPCAFFVCC